ncbi:MAG: helix-turn-helix transcriptional regulator [Coriobacteriales bacterium]|nr:helix-turn-helix transcriptional regulator [Coriobacteriales bacterium]
MIEEKKPGLLRGEVLLRQVGLVAFVTLLLFLSDGSPSAVFMLGGSEATRFALFAMLITIIVCGLVYAFRGTLDPKAHYRFMGAKGSACAVLGGAIIGLSVYSGLPVVIVVLGGMTLGLGLSILGMGWGMEIASRQTPRAFRRVVYAVLIASPIKLILPFAPRPLLAVVLTVLVVASSALPVVVGGNKDVEYGREISALELARGALERNWLIFLGLILCMSINAFLWGIAFTEPVFAQDSYSTHQWASALGACLAGVLLWALTRRDSLDSLRPFSLFAPLVCVASILVAWFIAVWNEGFSSLIGLNSDFSIFLSSAPVGFSVTTLCLLLVFRLGVEARNGLPLSFTLGMLAAVSSASFLAFNTLQYFGREIGNAVDLTLKIVYLAIATIYLVMLAQKKPDASSGVSEQRLAEIREHYALSKRETEILALLIRGRSAPYIAETEFISLNTVKTHMKRLYTKTGVHNKEELLDIVYHEGDD